MNWPVSIEHVRVADGAAPHGQQQLVEGRLILDASALYFVAGWPTPPYDGLRGVLSAMFQPPVQARVEVSQAARGHGKEQLANVRHLDASEQVAALPGSFKVTAEEIELARVSGGKRMRVTKRDGERIELWLPKVGARAALAWAELVNG